MSTLAALGAKPASAWAKFLEGGRLAPVGASRSARVESLALIRPTEPATSVRAPRPPAAEAALGTLETRSSSLSVAPGASLEAEAAVGAAIQLDRQRLGRIELQVTQPLGLAGALRLQDGAARIGGLGVELAHRLGDGVGGSLRVGRVDLQAVAAGSDERSVGADGEGLDIFGGSGGSRVRGVLGVSPEVALGGAP